MSEPKHFALIGVGGYIAPRHLRAIKDTGNELVACLDPKDSVGIIDSFFPDAQFFTEFERFDRHLEKLRRDQGRQVDFVSICSPNYLHDAHIRFALRIGANAICEKPVVLNPWNVDALKPIAEENHREVNVILQLRLHEAVRALKDRIASEPDDAMHDVELTYITPRGRWYGVSWKGDAKKSGGVATNIGIHFFDMLTWIFGAVQESVVHLAEETKTAGFMQLPRARVRWYLSLDRNDLPEACRQPGALKPFRSITVDGEEVEFSQGFTDLHTLSYQQILAGNGFGLDEAKKGVEIVSDIRNAEPVTPDDRAHPLLRASG